MTSQPSPLDRWDELWPTFGEPDLVHEIIPVRFRILPRGTNWEVLRNAAFWGIFQSRSEADDTVRAKMIEIFAAGGSAQVRFI